MPIDDIEKDSGFLWTEAVSTSGPCVECGKPFFEGERSVLFIHGRQCAMCIAKMIKHVPCSGCGVVGHEAFMSPTDVGYLCDVCFSKEDSIEKLIEEGINEGLVQVGVDTAEPDGEKTQFTIIDDPAPPFEIKAKNIKISIVDKAGKETGEEVTFKQPVFKNPDWKPDGVYKLSEHLPIEKNPVDPKKVGFLAKKVFGSKNEATCPKCGITFMSYAAAGYEAEAVVCPQCHTAFMPQPKTEEDRQRESLNAFVKLTSYRDAIKNALAPFREKGAWGEPINTDAEEIGKMAERIKDLEERNEDLELIARQSAEAIEKLRELVRTEEGEPAKRRQFFDLDS